MIHRSRKAHADNACAHTLRLFSLVMPHEQDIPGLMPQAPAAPLELGRRPIRGTRRKTIPGCPIGQRRSRIQQIQDRMGVVFTVGGDMQLSPTLEFLNQQRDEGRLNQAPFVMPCLGPRIGKKICTRSRQRSGTCRSSTSTASAYMTRRLVSANASARNSKCPIPGR